MNIIQQYFKVKRWYLEVKFQGPKVIFRGPEVAGSIPRQRPWSYIFRNWLISKMYIFPILKFTLLEYFKAPDKDPILHQKWTHRPNPEILGNKVLPLLEQFPVDKK